MRSDANGLLGVLHTHVPLGTVVLKTLVSFLASCCRCNSSDFVQVVLLKNPQIWLHHFTDMVFSIIFIHRKCFLFWFLGLHSQAYVQKPTLTLLIMLIMSFVTILFFLLHSYFFHFSDFHVVWTKTQIRHIWSHSLSQLSPESVRLSHI